MLWRNLSADDLFCFRFFVLDFEDGPEEAIKAVWIQDCTEFCVVGLPPRNIVKSRKYKFIDKLAQVIELYEYSKTEQSKEIHRNLGMAS